MIHAHDHELEDDPRRAQRERHEDAAEARAYAHGRFHEVTPPEVGEPIRMQVTVTLDVHPEEPGESYATMAALFAAERHVIAALRRSGALAKDGARQDAFRVEFVDAAYGSECGPVPVDTVEVGHG